MLFRQRCVVFIRGAPEDVARRFIRDVQRADMNATRMSDPIMMIERRRKSRSAPIVVIASVSIIVLGLGWVVYRMIFSGPAAQPPPPPVVTAPAPQAPSQAPPRPATRPQVAVPQARPQPQTFPRTHAESATPS